MANGDLLKALCPSPEEWKLMEQKEFQEHAGKCLGYLLHRDQQRKMIDSGASFIGGIIGGAIALLGYLGLK
jgi:prolipoprotein diacylglyceryltransferase